MVISIKTVTTKKDLERCFYIREEVFIKEQKISEYIEFDDETLKATYFAASYGKKIVGTARCRSTKGGVKLERFAVLRSFRNLGIGRKLLLFMLSYIKNEGEIYLHAQKSVIEFYAKLGFKRIGSRFFEAEIPHQKMIYDQNLNQYG